tara:strand:- start:460 stop:1008 length:549 start_codon:yes stop_codon:yes gene_type:complete
MQRVVLSEINLIHGEIKTPKGYEIDRKKIKNDIIDSYINQNRISINPKDYSFEDYKIPFSNKLQWFKDYIRDHFNEQYRKTLVPKLEFGNVLRAGERSILRNTVDPVDLRNSPDFTCVYGVEINGECDLIIEYDENRRKGRTWHIPLKNNYYYIFPSTQRYFFTPHNSDKLNIILTITYEYI